MRIRKAVFPKGIGDIGATTFFLFAYPFVFWYEIVIVLPYFYDPSTFLYKFHFVCGMLVFLNTVASFLFTILCDTSVKGRLIQSTDGIKLCSICNSIQPPRAWHCPLCKICILKRDHHCIFTSTCIGFYNYRYFYTMILFVTIGALYAAYFHICYTYHKIEYGTLATIVRIFMPFLMIFFDDTPTQFIVAVFIIVGISSGIGIAMVIFYYNLIRKGQTNNDHKRKITKYDLGFKQNLREVFGERWYIAWLSPIIPSKLPGDGIHFKINDSYNKKNI